MPDIDRLTCWKFCGNRCGPPTEFSLTIGLCCSVAVSCARGYLGAVAPGLLFGGIGWIAGCSPSSPGAATTSTVPGRDTAFTVAGSLGFVGGLLRPFQRTEPARPGRPEGP